MTPVYPKSFHDSSDICLMAFIDPIQICEISHQTFGPSHRKCPMGPMIFMNTVTRSCWCTPLLQLLRCPLHGDVSHITVADTCLVSGKQVEAQPDHGPGSEIETSWKIGVPKMEFQDGGGRTRLFTHKIIIFA